MSDIEHHNDFEDVIEALIDNDPEKALKILEGLVTDLNQKRLDAARYLPPPNGWEAA